mgnify:CR=1 FL=1
MRIVFMGTPDFAEVSLKQIYSSGIDIGCVVTQPDRVQGRGNKLIFSPVKKFAIDNDIKVVQPDRAEHEIQLLKDIAPDFIVVVAFGQILKKEILDIPSKATINVHASLLPEYRGASPINRAIINGSNITGVTTMILDEGMDTGDMLMSEKTTIHDYDTAESLHDRLSKIGAELIVRTLNDFDSIVPEKQDNSVATYAPKLKKEDGNIRWDLTAKDIRNTVRGCNPWPSSFTFHQNVCLKIWEVNVLTDISEQGNKPGQILSADNELIVNTGKGLISVKEIQREGKKRQNIETFLIGYNISPGDMFTSNAFVQE